MEIGITMLGTTGTGKTCYLYAMADRMTTGVNNLTFSPSDYEVGLDLDDQWGKICDGVWPGPSNITEEYKFICAYSMRPIIDFRWYDYKGGLLNQVGDEIDKVERPKVLEKMNNSEGLIVCVSAEHLKGLLQGNSSASRPFKAYSRLLFEFRRKNGHTIPVMFAVTKADLISNEEFGKGVELLKSSVFAPLFVEDGDWFIGFVPVSLGRNFKTDGNRIVGGCINPWNIEVPVLFCIKACLDIRVQEFEDLIEEFRADKGNYGARLARELEKSGWDKFWNGDDNDIYKMKIEEIDEKMQKIIPDFERLRRDVDNIGRTIIDSGAKVYLNGCELG